MKINFFQKNGGLFSVFEVLNFLGTKGIADLVVFVPGMSFDPDPFDGQGPMTGVQTLP